MDKYFEIGKSTIDIYDENIEKTRSVRFMNEVEGLSQITRDKMIIALHEPNIKILKNDFYEILDDLPMSALISACDSVKDKKKRWRK